MAKTELSLEVSNNSNLKVMRLYDTSHYNQDEVVNNYLIEVLPVNKTQWITFNVRKHFSLVLNSSNLKYNKPDEVDGLIDLPDGIYEIKQSYTPNMLTMNHFYFFRNTELINKIQAERHKLFDEKCLLERNEFILNRDKLRDIEEYAIAAKYMVEESHDKAKGIEMYEFAKKLIEHYTNECQC